LAGPRKTAGVSKLLKHYANIDIYNKKSFNYLVTVTTREYQPDQEIPQELLQKACELFRATIPSFDAEDETKNPELIADRDTPELYRTLLKDRSLILALDTHDQVAGLLEWYERERENIVLMFITWMMVDQSRQGSGIASLLHQHFETQSVPRVAAKTSNDVFQALGVHLKNERVIEIYRGWDYEDATAQYNDGRMLCMSKLVSRK